MTAYAENSPVIIDDGFFNKTITNNAIRVYASKTLPLSSVQEHIDQWLPIVPLSPIPQNGKVWAKTTVLHKGVNSIQLTAVASNTFATKLEGFVVDERGSIKKAYSQNKRGSLGHQFSFTLMPGERVDIYIAIEDEGPSFLPLSLWQADALSKITAQTSLYKMLFSGAMGCLILYFFLTYFVQRNVCRYWFALTVFMLLFFVLQKQGLTLPVIGNLLTQTTLVYLLAALALLAASKVTHYHLFRLPKRLDWMNYAVAAMVVLPLLFTSSYVALILSTLFAGLWLALQIAYSFIYNDRRLVLPSILYGIAWLTGLITYLLHIGYFLTETPHTSLTVGISLMAILSAAIIAGIAIETSERGIRIREFSHQEKRIENLRQFYDLFRNSAEGLYTSTKDGQLLSVNPAMCQLFGYTNEDTMLKQVKTTEDFYAHPEDRVLLLEELNKHQSLLGREIKGKKRDGSEFWFSLSCQRHIEGKKEYLYGSIFDITERKQSSLSLEYLATHDSLTGVLNRREFERILTTLLDNYNPSIPACLLYIDLDRFKLVNDSCGHRAGDELIKKIATLIHETVGAKGKVARLGGDEFAVITSDVDEDDAYVCANKLLNAIQDYRFLYENKIFSLGASIGFLRIDTPDYLPEHLVSMADAACYIAKEKGRNQIHKYSPDDKSVKRYESEIKWINKINDALEHDNFVLYYQQYQALQAKKDGIYIEVLIRINDEGNIIAPALFLNTAERYSLANKIDRWVIENTLAWLGNNPDVLAILTQCNINLSGQSLADKDLKLAILNAFEQHGVPYNKVCFEITETTAVVRLEETLDFIKTFKGLGCKFALDDFGSGFSSYAYLKNLPVDCVKIDGSFIRELLLYPVNQAMVSSINDIAKAMNMETVAEFVEDEATLIQLGKIGIDFAQGYLVSTPQPLDMLANNN
ncbi:EAL domain-containing protein [Alteromonas sediminis]|nr:EAL domain-containing protein [Alteromonas sediminis]